MIHAREGSKEWAILIFVVLISSTNIWSWLAEHCAWIQKHDLFFHILAICIGAYFALMWFVRAIGHHWSKGVEKVRQDSFSDSTNQKITQQ